MVDIRESDQWNINSPVINTILVGSCVNVCFNGTYENAIIIENNAPNDIVTTEYAYMVFMVAGYYQRCYYLQSYAGLNAIYFSLEYSYLFVFLV